MVVVGPELTEINIICFTQEKNDKIFPVKPKENRKHAHSCNNNVQY